MHWRNGWRAILSVDVMAAAIEQAISGCTGAVFVAARDPEAAKPGQPNENVMLELGLVAARLAYV